MATDGLHKYGMAALFGISLIACAQMPSSPGALTKEESDMSTEERSEVLPQSKFGAEAALLKLLELIRGSKSIEDFTPEKLSNVMGLQMNFDGPDRFGAAETLTQDWSYGFHVDRTGMDGPVFSFSFKPRGNGKRPPATAICQLDFNNFALQMERMDFSQEAIYGEHGRLIEHQFYRPGFYIEVITEGEAGDPVEKIAHKCVMIVIIK
jgi:hypothetical protein